MTREEFRARWNSRLTECVRLGILVDGERFCHEVLADFDAVIRAEDDRLLSLADCIRGIGVLRRSSPATLSTRRTSGRASRATDFL